MTKIDKAKVLEQFVQDWWKVLLEHREEVNPTDWLIVIGTMTGMLVDSVTETEEQAKECLTQFSSAVTGVAGRFVDTAVTPPNVH